MNAEGSEEEIHTNILLFKKNVPHPSPTNLIYYENLTTEQVVDKAMNYNYRSIQL